jgi:hypothetical protein
MILNSHIYKQLAEMHQRDLRDTARHHRPAPHARQPSAARSFRSILRGWGSSRQSGPALSPTVSRPSTATR